MNRCVMASSRARDALISLILNGAANSGLQDLNDKGSEFLSFISSRSEKFSQKIHLSFDQNEPTYTQDSEAYAASTVRFV
jgi:hypothetical protein